MGFAGLIEIEPTYSTSPALATEPSTLVAVMVAVPCEAPAVTRPVEGSTESTAGAELVQTTVGLRALIGGVYEKVGEWRGWVA